MEIIIRRAVQEDCPRLLELIHELATYEKAPQEVTVTLGHFIESGFGEKPVWWAFVACLPHALSGIVSGNPPEAEAEEEEAANAQNLIVGFALYYIRYSTWKGQAMYLEDIIVTEAMRGKGVGKFLFDQLIEEAKEKGFNRITWQVLEWNEPAINFYKKYNAMLDAEWVNCSMNIR